ncbi:mannitol dehydrogenase family protein [Rhodococcus erythropolis]|uniref:mannitol dehydrogenase family protein n=1 Tax=Rhodococcus erythropolis TaxID=1833 RepID=UPI001E4D6AE3|nr:MULTISPECIES: mannitol dehydrogenase family protein [Rhodococcus erythropolis group]MCD2104981.1 mannitol dehydrogenase family protein [Rhodococcus qingshengii]MCZ4526358.1 mannitol dehydrogenase family protein [Rhodococcus erythropolis]
MELNTKTVHNFDTSLQVPNYDRSKVTTGIVHFGVGGFHRAHQAMYIDTLLRRGEGFDWGICGVGVMPSDKRMRDALRAQDGLFTLALKHADGTLEGRVIGSIVEYLFAPDDPQAVIEKMASESTKIVSLTITEGGYNISDSTGEFDSSNPDVVHDLEPGTLPRTTFGLICAALALRRDRGLAPFTIMSCDNIEGNGSVARNAFGAFAALKDPELAEWIEKNGAFPNSMVDRITPVTTAEVTAEIAETFGVEDQWPIAAEPFTAWFLEDEFTMGRPPLENAGVNLVPDVRPYELMKLRLLNASHQGIAYFGYLAGYRLVHEACQDELLSGFLLDYMNLEATPTLDPVPGVDLDQYKKTLIERFSNPHVRDTIARLCAESSDRIPKWLLPVIRKQLDAGGSINLSTAIVASWVRYAEGSDENGDPINVVDQMADTLVPLAQKQSSDPLAFIGNRQVFGDLVDDRRFVASFRKTLDSLHSVGARKTLEEVRGL